MTRKDYEYDQDRDACSHCGDPVNCNGGCERAIFEQEAANALAAALERQQIYRERKQETVVEQDQSLDDMFQWLMERNVINHGGE